MVIIVIIIIMIIIIIIIELPCCWSYLLHGENLLQKP